jgi:hypothetical protein
LGPPRINGKLNPAAFRPAFPAPLEIKGQHQTTSRSHVSNEGLAILHFVLEGMESRGSPARIIAEFMAAYLPKSSLLYEEVFFNLAEARAIASHARTMRDLKKHIR